MYFRYDNTDVVFVDVANIPNRTDQWLFA